MLSTCPGVRAEEALGAGGGPSLLPLLHAPEEPWDVLYEDVIHVSLPLSLYIYIYIHIIHMCTYMYIYIYIYTYIRT